MLKYRSHPDRYARAIFALIEEKGLSFYRFARMTGMTEGALRSMRDRQTGVSSTTVRKVCTALGITEEELLAKSDSVDTVNTPIVRVSVQLGDDSVQNSQLILRAFKNMAAEQARLAAAMGQLNEGLSDLGVALEKAVEVEKREHVPDPATTRKATGTNGTR